MNKKKILRIIARLNQGGPAIHVMLLNSGLNKEKFITYLATGSVAEGERDISYMAKEMGVDPLVIPRLSREISLKNDLDAFFKLYKLIRRLKPDIVHTHTAKAGALGRVAAALNRVPIKIHTFHGHVFHSYFGRLKSSIFIAIERILTKFTDRIIVISQSQLNDVMNRYRIAPKKKCSLIQLGLDLEPYLRIKKKDSQKSISIGIIGRLVKVKNHKMFLDAVNLLGKRYPDIKAEFMIVGSGELKNELEEYTRKLKIENKVNFAGWQTDLESIYKKLDIVALTSLNEGTPISLIEAMASGKPVLSTNVGGVNDVVIHNETGLLCESNNVEDFSANLLNLIKDSKLRDRLGSNGRKFVSKKFGKDRLIKDIEDLYESELKREDRWKQY